MNEPQAENTHEEEDSVSADIDRAWAEHENAEPSDDPVPDPGTDDGDADAPDPVSGEDAEPEPPGDEAAKAEKPVSEKADAGAVDKPPAGLSAAAREAWKTAPKELKADIIKRERDYAVGLQKNAEWAQRAQQMDQALAPYGQYMAMNGGARSVVDLLQTASTLQMGTPQQKAEMAAQVIQQFGVDINMLDTVLSGQSVPNSQPQLSEREQRIERFLQQQEEQQRYQQQQSQAEVNQTVGAFMNDPKNEFADLVRDDMADLLDGAARRGVAMTLDEAYTKACRMRDDIAPILASRSNSGNLQKRKNASSSISGAPGGSVVSKATDSVRSALEAAWDEAGQI
jgi:hypothetical protein